MGNTNTFGLIKSMLEDLPKAEQRVAEYILNNQRDSLKLTAQELGKASHASAATVVRFSKRLGMDSYSHMKLVLMKEVDNGAVKGYSDISANETLSDIKDKLLGNAYQSLSDTATIIDNSIIESAIQAIEKANIIYIFGIGSSYLAAENLGQKWNRVGKTCVVMQDPHNMISSIVSNTQEKLFIGISNSGKTNEVLKLMNIAMQNNCTTMSITQFGKNPIQELGKIKLEHARVDGQVYRTAATVSLHVQFYVIEVLFHAYASKHFDSVINNVIASREETSMYSAK